jgi:L-lactate dehydrogenase complex protein LldG
MDAPSEKEKILGRIREALRAEAPHPGHGHQNPHPAPGSESLRRWLPPVGEDIQQRFDLFRANAATLKAEFVLVETEAELVSRVKAIRDVDTWRKVGSHSGQLTDAVCRELNLPVCRTDQAYDAANLEACDAGITECDALVAQTGSVLITSRSAGGRALSVLPPHHVVLARRAQLLPDLPEAFSFLKQKYAPHYPSFISFITGPSRTGDIERILVLGAHGPKKLTILCF